MKRNGLYRRREVFCFRYKTLAGGWREKSTQTADRAQATAFKTQFLADLAINELPTDLAERTVKQGCEAWVALHGKTLAKKSRQNEESYLRQLLSYGALAKKKLKLVTLVDFTDYQSYRLETVKALPINRELDILYSVLQEANLWRGGLLKYKRLRVVSKPGTAIDMKALRRLELVASTRPHWHVAMLCMILASNTGMRGGEIRKLKRGAIHLDESYLDVTRESTKNEGGIRRVGLNAAAIGALRRLLSRAELLGSTEPGHYLLPRDLTRRGRGTGWDPAQHQDSFHHSWASLKKTAGLPDLRFHDLRHSFITAMAENDVPLSVTRDQVGHLSPTITRRYEHIRDQTKLIAVQKLDALRKQHGFVDNFVDEDANVLGNPRQ